MASFPKVNKIVKDPLYSHVHIPKLCQQFMDVPEFQRLRRVKQLGTAYYAYPSAVHTRFEHSIGVMYLAGKVVDHLRQFTEIPDRCKELIQLAALYHDIGHFSLSHLFDSYLEEFAREFDRWCKNYITVNEEKVYLKHENRSILILEQVNIRLKLLNANDVRFVADCINPERLNGSLRNHSQEFVYQIVNNKQCGIDVDKLDYLARDAYHTNFPAFQCGYIIECMRIHNGNIVFLNKVKDDIVDLFETRRRMFRMVYFHHTCSKVDQIYKYMMKLLGEKLFIYGNMSDDFNLETLLRNNEETKSIMHLLDCRDFASLSKIVKFSEHEYSTSGSIDDVKFI